MKLPKLTGKQKFVIISVLFTVWIVFFDEVRVTLWLKQWADNNQTKREIEGFNKKTIELERQIKAFKTSRDSIEKFVREYYFMKRDNEDIYVFD